MKKVKSKKTILVMSIWSFMLPYSYAANLEGQDTTQLTDIMVTGEKAQKSILNTASSVEINNAQRIQAKGSMNTSDLMKSTVNVIDLGTENGLPTVRGIDGSGPAVGGVAFLAGTRPRINLSVDGRSVGYNEFAFGSKALWDVQQVEIFRGPQSYSQGRNAIAGSIVMKSADPTDYWEGAIKTAVGNYHSYQTAAMISGPIVDDQLSFRLSVDKQGRESFVDLMSYEPAGNPKKYETTTARAKLLYAPSDIPGFMTKFTYNFSKSRAPQTEALDNPNGARYSPERPVFKTANSSYISDTSWQISDSFTLENQLVYSVIQNDRITVLRPPVDAYAMLDGKEFHIEPILRYKSSNGMIKALLGYRYFHAKQDEFANVFGGNSFVDKTETQSLFAEANIAFSTALDLTVAGRFERENHQRKGGGAMLNLDLDKTYNTFMPSIDLAWHPQQNITTGVRVARGYNPGGAGITFDRPFVAYTYDPEYVWNYEGYYRHRLNNDTIALTSNIFYNDYKDMQLPYNLGPRSVAIRNAKKVETYGAELGFKWKPMTELEFYSALGLLHTNIKKFGGSGIEGNKLGRAPAYTFNTGINYIHEKGWEAGATYRLISSYYSGYNNLDNRKVSSHSLANLHAGYNFKNVRIIAYINNVFNTRKATFYPSADKNDALLERPRMLGLSAEFKF